MSRRFDANLVIDSGKLGAYPQEDRRNLNVLVNRMCWLRERALDNKDSSGNYGARNVEEYAALHWVLEKMGVVKFETDAEPSRPALAAGEE